MEWSTCTHVNEFRHCLLKFFFSVVYHLRRVAIKKEKKKIAFCVLQVDFLCFLTAVKSFFLLLMSNFALHKGSCLYCRWSQLWSSCASEGYQTLIWSRLSTPVVWMFLMSFSAIHFFFCRLKRSALPPTNICNTIFLAHSCGEYQYKHRRLP